MELYQELFESWKKNTYYYSLSAPLYKPIQYQ